VRLRLDSTAVRSSANLVTILGVCVLVGAVGSLLNHEQNGARFGIVFGGAMIVLSEWARWRRRH
jgi:hypothetical protein